jgi:hypothetical protein
MPPKSVLLVATTCLAVAACESKAPTASTDAAAPSTAPSADASVADAANPAAKVEPLEYDDKMFPGELPAGEPLGGFAFRDTAGDNFVAFSRDETTAKNGALASVLHIKHVVKNGDDVKEVRAYREVIEACEFDIILDPKFGKWSVTDLDADGVGEANFAYTHACTSDVSPNGHKVFVTEGGEKYVLRGVTSIEFAPGQIEGGEFDADDMPDEFREHADMVWQETSIGLRMR